MKRCWLFYHQACPGSGCLVPVLDKNKDTSHWPWVTLYPPGECFKPNRGFKVIFYSALIICQKKRLQKIISNIITSLLMMRFYVHNLWKLYRKQLTVICRYKMYEIEFYWAKQIGNEEFDPELHEAYLLIYCFIFSVFSGFAKTTLKPKIYNLMLSCTVKKKRTAALISCRGNYYSSKVMI